MIKGVKVERGSSNKYSCQGLISLTGSTRNPNQPAYAIEYSKMGFPVFPCDSNKAPIVDHSLGFAHGFKDATLDLKLIARTWFKYPEAGIGLGIPEDIIVFDCDVEKNSDHEPLVFNGEPVMIGIRSFEGLARDLGLSEIDLNTLTIKTQSEGRHYYYKMPDGVSSFNHTRALDGLDLKGYGGYVILPRSQGQYGKYEFLNLTEIRTIPEPLLKWALKFKGSAGEFKPLPAGSARVDRDAIVSILTPYWDMGDGRRNDLTLAIAGFIARSGGTENDSTYIITRLCGLTGKGKDHISGAKYAFHREGNIRGFYTLTRIMEEIANDRK